MLAFSARFSGVILVLLLAAALCAGCSPAPSPTPSVSPQNILHTQTPAPGTPAPSITPGGDRLMVEAAPESLRTDDGSQPVVKVYVTEEQAVREMPIETYLCGVLAGEMNNQWPMEALRAQAILARTYAVKFVEDKGGSKYREAHLSTDIAEAQAYDAAGINDRIREAINSTRGMLAVHGGHPIYAWFHAHAGGMTALAGEGLEYERDDPPYIAIVASKESDQAPPDDAAWRAAFTRAELAAALSNWGDIGAVGSIGIAQRGPSGRAITLNINGTEISAPSLRLHLGAEKLKSTLLTSIRMDGAGGVVFEGKGYGHGVGMSQWGAYRMAEEGLRAEDIIQAYFRDVSLVMAWR